MKIDAPRDYRGFFQNLPNCSNFGSIIFFADNPISNKEGNVISIDSQDGYCKWVIEINGGKKSKKYYKEEIKRWKGSDRSVDIMRRALRFKFSSQNPELLNALVETYPARLSEMGRMKNEFWADTGANMLGLLLEEIRREEWERR